MELSAKREEALGLHQRILASGQIAAGALVDFCRQLKEMRDRELYRELGYEDFAAYAEQAVGLRQRQAYNYISTYERLGPKLLGENAGLGITKLELLAQVSAPERQEVLEEHDLDGMTAAEVRQLVAELQGAREQLTLFGDQRQEAVARAEGAERALEELRREPLETVQGHTDEELEAAAQAARREAREEAEKEKAKAVREARRQAKEDAAVQAERAVAKAREEAVEAAREEERRRAREAGAETERARQEALARAEKLERELELARSSESTEFALLFGQMQETYQKMLELLERMRDKGQEAQAGKLEAALQKAMEAMMGDG